MGATATLPEALIEALRAAQRVCVLTGAGVSAESGVPTFREAQTGLWEKYRPESLATMEAFLADPAFVWQWYRWRRELVAKTQPNPGHLALADLEKRYEEFTLVTQNVDRLHRAAGSVNVVEFHGDLFADVCVSGCADPAPSDDEIPYCNHCGNLLRPGVVWFGEAIPQQALLLSSEAAENCDVMLCIGTSSQVYPAAGLSGLARHSGAVTAEINPEPSGGPEFNYVIAGKSGLILPELVASLKL